MIALKTKRFLLRRFRVSDAEDLFLLNLDKEVIKFTGDIPFKNIEEAREFVDNYDHYAKYDFGRWAVVDKTNNEFFGWCGLKYSEKLDEVDIGFRFFKKYWNKGIATESATACLEFGFRHYKLKSIVGRAIQVNSASIKVLEKLGMKFVKKIDFDGFEGAKFIKYNNL